MKEIWKDIVGYEGLYQVSNCGRVKSLEKEVIHKRYGTYKLKEKILKQYVEKLGYVRVGLYKNCKIKHFLLHRLIAEAFIPNPYNKPYIDHIDGNPKNNNIDNLRWCTHKENMNNPIAEKRTSDSLKGHNTSEETKKKIGKSHSISIYQIDKTNGCIIREWSSMTDVERELGIDHRKICNCCKGKRKSTGGYIWRYA